MLSLPPEASHRACGPETERARRSGAAWPPGALGRELASAAPGGHAAPGPRPPRRTSAALDLRQSLLERGHEVGHGGGLLLLVRDLDRLALGLLAHDLLQALGVAVLVAVRVPRAGQGVDQRDRLVDLLLGRLVLLGRRRDVLGRAHLVVPKQRRQHEPVLA